MDVKSLRNNFLNFKVYQHEHQETKEVFTKDEKQQDDMVTSTSQDITNSYQYEKHHDKRKKYIKDINIITKCDV